MARMYTPADMEAWRNAITSIESGGRYNARGPVTNSGDRAYGRYQVMGNNVGPWTEKYYGERLTPQQFLNNPAAQDAVFQGEFGRLAGKHGPEGAARAWFAGEGGMNRLGSRDILGTRVGDYGRKFEAALGRGGVRPEPWSMAEFQQTMMPEQARQAAWDSGRPALPYAPATYDPIGEAMRPQPASFSSTDIGMAAPADPGPVTDFGSPPDPWATPRESIPLLSEFTPPDTMRGSGVPGYEPAPDSLIQSVQSYQANPGGYGGQSFPSGDAPSWLASIGQTNPAQVTVRPSAPSVARSAPPPLPPAQNIPSRPIASVGSPTPPDFAKSVWEWQNPAAPLGSPLDFETRLAAIQQGYAPFAPQLGGMQPPPNSRGGGLMDGLRSLLSPPQASASLAPAGISQAAMQASFDPAPSFGPPDAQTGNALDNLSPTQVAELENLLSSDGLGNLLGFGDMTGGLLGLPMTADLGGFDMGMGGGFDFGLGGLLA